MCGRLSIIIQPSFYTRGVFVLLNTRVYTPFLYAGQFCPVGPPRMCALSILRAFNPVRPPAYAPSFYMQGIFIPLDLRVFAHISIRGDYSFR
jgi:hypothetical protein